MNHMDPIKTLQSLEPVFIQAGQLAYTMQKSAASYNKRETGDPVSDIVTEADLAVQEFLLQEIGKTDLVNCRLLAEEDTASTQKFNEQGKYYLGIDPIDDTAIYARGGRHFSTILSLHDGKKMLYVFVYYPVWNWIHRIVNNAYSVEGTMSDVLLPPEFGKTIAYWSGNPEEHIPKNVLQQIHDKGVSFSSISAISKEFGTIGLFATNKVAGVYHENMNAYDGLVEFSIASVKGQKIYSSGPHGDLDLSDISKEESGLYYPGYYLALSDLFDSL